MAQFKHLSLSERISIQSMLSQNGLSAIARELGRDRKTIVREIQQNRTFIFIGSYGLPKNNCDLQRSCQIRHLCENCINRRGKCSLCEFCNERCKEFVVASCVRLNKPPFCCNGCRRQRSCNIHRFFYDAEKAHFKALSRRKEARSGILLSQVELERTDQLVSPLLKKGQSIHHIYIHHADELFCSERTLYNLIDNNLLTARNLDLRLKVKRKVRRLKPEHKVDKACRKGRTFEDFRRFMENRPESAVVQMDSVIGNIHSIKVLLTLFFPQAQLLLCRIRYYNTARSALAAIESIEAILGRETFQHLFPVLLTDNGSEFSDPKALEKGGRTRIFYCDPQQSNQKSQIERAHQFIRMVRPKGASFDNLSQKDIDLMCSHINSYCRESLGNKCPFDVFEFIYGQGILEKLGIRKIEADEILLTNRLLPLPK